MYIIWKRYFSFAENEGIDALLLCSSVDQSRGCRFLFEGCMLLRWDLWRWLNVSFDCVCSILSSWRISKDLETYAFESVSWYFTRKLYKTGDFIFDTVFEWFEVGFTQWVLNCLGAAQHFPSKIVLQPLFMGRRFSTPCWRTWNSSIFSLRACSHHWQKIMFLFISIFLY